MNPVGDEPVGSRRRTKTQAKTWILVKNHFRTQAPVFFLMISAKKATRCPGGQPWEWCANIKEGQIWFRFNYIKLQIFFLGGGLKLLGKKENQLETPNTYKPWLWSKTNPNKAVHTGSGVFLPAVHPAPRADTTEGKTHTYSSPKFI